MQLNSFFLLLQIGTALDYGFRRWSLEGRTILNAAGHVIEVASEEDGRLVEKQGM